MLKIYKQISDTELEETTTSLRVIKKEFIERELEAIKENIIANQVKEKELEDLLKQFKIK